MSVRSSAPGKVIVSGEYAVLEGAPAVVMAVNRRARVCVSAASGKRHRVAAPGLFEGEIDFPLVDGEKQAEAEPRRPAVDLSLVSEILKSVGADPAAPLKIELDTRPFFHEQSGLKLGFGSSAALTVALVSALEPGANAEDIARTALLAHRAWQGGRGSGADIAAAVHGGTIAYSTMPGSTVETLRWPDRLRFALLWSGRPAATRSRIEAFRESVRRRGAADDLNGAAMDMLAAWRQGDCGMVLECLARYVRVLLAFDRDRDLGIFEAGHRTLAQAARDPVVYKPCGAGGGDIGMVFASEQRDLDEFVGMARSVGFERLDVQPDARGVE